MISRLKQILKCNKGQGYPLATAITLALLLIIIVVTEYFRLMIIAQGVRDSLQDAVISTVTENYADVYHTTREGYSGGYQPANGDFSESLNYGNIYLKLENVLGLEYTDDRFIKIIDENIIEYSLYDLKVDIQNVPIRTGQNSDETFNVDSFITLEVPISFLGEILPPMKIYIKTSALYTPLF